MVSGSRSASGSADLSVRAAAVDVVRRTLRSLAPVSSFLARAGAPFGARDRRLLSHLVIGVLRWRRRLDHVIAEAAKRPVSKIDAEVLGPLEVGAYQLLYMDRVPAHAAVDTAVEIVRRGPGRATGFANAVLRRIAERPRLEDWPVRSGDPIARLAIETSHPDFLVYRWLVRLGRERTEALLAANNREKPMHLLAFADRGGRGELKRRLADEGVVVEDSELAPLGLVVRSGSPLRSQAFADGDFYVQDSASQAAALIPPPSAGDLILDATAAPGGKAFALVSFDHAVRPVLADVSLPRVRYVRENLRRLRRSMRFVFADATSPPFRAGFDRVVLDLPCTGTGTFRKNPELKWRVSEQEIERLAHQGGAMLSAAAPLVRPGGRVSVITCSLEPEENEDVVERFLERHAEFQLESFAERHERWIQAGLESATRWRLMPGNGHDGFSVHSLIRS